MLYYAILYYNIPYHTKHFSIDHTKPNHMNGYAAIGTLVDRFKKNTIYAYARNVGITLQNLCALNTSTIMDITSTAYIVLFGSEVILVNLLLLLLLRLLRLGRRRGEAAFTIAGRRPAQPSDAF